MDDKFSTSTILLGQRIREARININQSQQEFAAKIGVSPTHLNKWEKGKVSPGWEYLTIIAEKASVSLDWLLAGKGSIKRDKKNEDDYIDYVEYTNTTLSKIEEKTGIEIDKKDKEYLLNIVRKIFSESKNKAEDKLTGFVKMMGE